MRLVKLAEDQGSTVAEHWINPDAVAEVQSLGRGYSTQIHMKSGLIHMTHMDASEVVALLNGGAE